jgi:EmrB/QacA subfamily drug resistance transporter
LLLLGGRLSDIIGRRTTFIIGLIGFAGASAFAGAAQSISWLIAGRALQGVFGAVLAPSTLSVLTTTFTDRKERARAFGVFGALAGAGGALGLLLGGWLTEKLDWRWTLYVNVVFALIAVVAGLTFLKNSRGPKPRLDVIGVILGGAGLFLLVFGFSRAAPQGFQDVSHWGAPLTWIPLAGGVLALYLFVLWERRVADYALLPLSIVADRNRGASFVCLFIAGGAMFAAFLFGTYYMQQNLGYSPLHTGVAFLPQVVGLITAAQITTNVLLPRFGPKVMIPIGMLLAAGGMVILANISPTSSYWTHVQPGLFVMGLGVGASMPSAIQTATLGIDQAHAGVGSSVVSTTQQIGGAIGTAVLNTIAIAAGTSWATAHAPAPADVAAATPEQIAAITASLTSQAQIHAYTRAFWVSAGMFAFGAVLTGLLFKRRNAVAYCDAAPESAG